MATANITLTESWQKIVDDGDEFFLSFPGIVGDPQIEVATSSGEPGVSGHRLNGIDGQEMNRTLIGDGDVWARSRTGSVSIILSAWTP